MTGDLILIGTEAPKDIPQGYTLIDNFYWRREGVGSAWHDGIYVLVRNDGPFKDRESGGALSLVKRRFKGAVG
jgi:hypothetical protein